MHTSNVCGALEIFSLMFFIRLRLENNLVIKTGSGEPRMGPARTQIGWPGNFAGGGHYTMGRVNLRIILG